MPDDTQKQPQATQVVEPVSGGLSKEAEMPSTNEASIEDVVEYEVDKEVADHVQVQKQMPDIPPDLQQIGVTHTPADQVVSEVVGTGNKIPLTDDQLNDGLSRPVSDSFRWFAEWCVKQLKEMHVQFQKINGRIVREPETT